MSIPSVMSILSNFNIFYKLYKVSSKNTCGYSLFSSLITHLIVTVILKKFKGLFSGKLSSELNLIFV